MAEFNAAQTETGVMGKCKLCGGKVRSVASPVYDSPGDCMPLISHYTYTARCDSCGTTTDHADNPKKIKCAFLKET